MRMDGGWRGVGGRALIVYSQEMEMGRGAVGAPTTPLSPAVGGGGIGGGGGGVTLGENGDEGFEQRSGKGDAR
ncbi:uncharacterized protein MONOS_12026 [Monocercomonoides exilis]|uniref:uncharacterized protein n=1 Tax=Monocercomonoides exilis TaxID=2049356 RepID=UPI0035596C55|nr:hypothetical protein MONOS_12026 [Monocercomonoides exilis]|eukprot:MONOS_12026.1-p1 / transcript=MONOS_12026.1 / gene=MONOS_12026 / organism=Monocercomonoides_exilis_PA203 / gene_product=unspecified product / transcript_product=unspecified product / location=Mono_scaffold00637:22443-22661(+) / protein_length=73 / sequence_SO=supercontig / SO=protein_coding / is_pseudo=false